MTRNPLTLTCYVISDGRAGIENQALGLAQAFAAHIAPLRPVEITPFIITHNAAMKAAQPLLQFTLKSKPQDYGLPTDRIADIAIGPPKPSIFFHELLIFARHQEGLSWKCISIYVCCSANDYQRMTSGWEKAPYSTIYRLGLV